MKKIVAILALAGAAGAANARPVTSQGDLTFLGAPAPAIVTSQTISIADADGWAFFTFCATQGDMLEIEVDRAVNGNMDPASSVVFGDATGLAFGALTGTSIFNWSGPGLSANLAQGDDDDLPAIPGPFGDPHYFLVAPSSGIYTVAISDFLGSGGPPFFSQIDVRGNHCVPAPGAAALLGLGGLIAGRRRRA